MYVRKAVKVSAYNVKIAFARLALYADDKDFVNS
jgi:hypothetical protein